METYSWLDPIAYPFKENYLQVEGGRLHYLDEGAGAPLLFVHGTPTWSFLWRQQIKELSKHYRCIALDHLGFGLSDKPKTFPYSLEVHRQNLGKLVDHLKIEKITLVVHDFGGPIGLGWAVRNPDMVAQLVIMNSWMWPLTEIKPMMVASKLFSSWLGKVLYTKFNFSLRVLLPQAFYQKENLTKEVQAHYLGPFQREEQRWGLWYFTKALAGETAYFQEVYNQRTVLQQKPTLLIWGLQDKLIPASFLEKWRKTLPQAKVVELDSGHFLQEENPLAVTKAIEHFLSHS